MTGNGNMENPRNVEQLPPRAQLAQQQGQRASIDDVASSLEDAARSIDEIARFAADYARNLRMGREQFIMAVHQMLGKRGAQ